MEKTLTEATKSYACYRQSEIDIHCDVVGDYAKQRQLEKTPTEAKEVMNKNLMVHMEQLNNGIYFWRVVSEPACGAPLSKWRGAGGEVDAQNGKIIILH